MPMGDARSAARLAGEAEAAGWDGFFVPDTVWGVDPWVALAAAAVTTQTIRLGPMLTPLSRRRPWKVASETATLDNLSGGRLILSVGLGAIDTGFANFGEVTDRRIRAELLDEGLEIVTGLWRGQPFRYEGRHYRVEETNFMVPPPPAQTPRIPIWVVGAVGRPKSMRRALRYDGILPATMTPRGTPRPTTVDDISAIRAYAAEHRAHEGPLDIVPFDIVMEGETPGDDAARAASAVMPLTEAGATWWIESRWARPDPDVVLTRVRQGPPAVA